MHLRQAEGDVGLCVAVELRQFVHQCGIIEIRKPPIAEPAFGFYTGILVKIVIGTEVIFIQQEVHLPAPFAAKTFIQAADRFITGIPAMVTSNLFYGRCFNNGGVFSKSIFMYIAVT